MIKRPFATIARRLIRKQSHLLFGAHARDIVRSANIDDLPLAIISAENVAQQRMLTDALIEMNPDNADYVADIVKDRIAGLVILDGGQPVHYGFVFKSNKTACLLGLPQGTALIGNSFTQPSHRGQGLQGRSVFARAEIAQSNGFAAIAAETHPSNVASQRGLIKCGMNLCGRVELIIVFSCFVIRWRRPPGIPMLGFCL